MTTQPSHLTRRNSLAFFAALPVLDAVGNEARLWKQEAELYFRRSGDAINTSFGDLLPRRSPPSPSASSQIKLNAEFAVAMLAAISKAAGRNAVQLQLDGNKLAEKELPFFQEAGTCGHCGTKPGPSGLKDRDYFDFLSYTRLKALLKLAREEYEDGGGAAIDATAVIEKKLRDTIGDAILRHILSEVDVGEAAAVGISPFRASGSASVALLGASPELDSIRGGVKALLTYFENKGFVVAFGISQFGISNDEYENHMVWARGEPAYLQYWLVSPADLRSTSALQSEEGANFGYISAAVAAYLRRCGVESEGLTRVPSLTDLDQVADQWTLRRVKPLPSGGASNRQGKGYKPWHPDTLEGLSIEDSRV